MNKPRRIVTCTLILLLVIGSVPLWNRTAGWPCRFLWWRHTSLYGTLRLPTLVAGNESAAIPPGCLDILQLQGHTA